MNKIWTVTALALVLVACKSNPMAPAKVEDVNANKAASKAAPAVDAASDDADKMKIKAVEVATGENDLDAAELAKRQVFFDYDSDAIREEYKGLVANHAKYLVAHSEAKVVLQGNADERGTREYNLSLGQRRSVAVKKALNLLGVSDAQIETVSYGEERSKQNCADDTCFQQDRRVDIVYAGK